MNAPIRDIWALVPGMSALPDDAARRRVLVALEVYVDDSGTGQPPVFLLAGFIARADAWALFKEEWRAALAAPVAQPNGKARTLTYFKMKEANALQGEFRGWTREAADQKVVELAQIAIKRAISGVYTGVMHQDFEDVVGAEADYPYPAPYFFTYHCLITKVLKFLDREGIDEPVDFIFDEQMHQSRQVQAAYDVFMDTAQRKLRKRLGNRPIHRSDKDFLPLQAADLLAWNVRRWFYEKSLGSAFTSPAMTALGTIHQEEDGWTRPRLENYIRGWRKTVAKKLASPSSPGGQPS